MDKTLTWAMIWSPISRFFRRGRFYATGFTLRAYILGTLLILGIIGILTTTTCSVRLGPPAKESVDALVSHTVSGEPLFHNGERIKVIGGFYKGEGGNVIDMIDDSTFVCSITNRNDPTPDCPGWFRTIVKTIRAKDLERHENQADTNSKTEEELKAEGLCGN